MDNIDIAKTLFVGTPEMPSSPPGKSSWGKYLVAGITTTTLVTFISAIIWLLSSAAAQDISLVKVNKELGYHEDKIAVLEECTQKSLDYLQAIDTRTQVMDNRLKTLEYSLKGR